MYVKSRRLQATWWAHTAIPIYEPLNNVHPPFARARLDRCPIIQGMYMCDVRLLHSQYALHAPL